MLNKIQPPLALSAGTNSLSSGTIVFSNLNGVSFGLQGSTLTGSVAAGGGAFNGGISGGNTLGSSGTVSNQMVLAGGNNITLSGSTNATGMSVTISAFNQTVQTQNLHNLSLSGNTAGAMAQISSGTAILAGGNNITLSQNGQSVTISGAAQTVQTQNLHNVSLSGNTAGVMAQVSSGTMILAGGNNITLSQNGQSITISGANAGGAQTGISGIIASNTTYTSGTVSFSGNNLTISSSVNGASQYVILSVAAQTNQSLGVYGSSQTTGQSSSSTLDARSITVVGMGGISAGLSGGSLVLSGPQTVAQTNQSIGIYGSSQTTGQSSSSTVDARSLTLVGMGGMSVGMSGGSVVLSGAQTVAQTNQSGNRYALGNTTGQSSSTTYDARTMSFAGAGIISVGYSSDSGMIISATQSAQSLGLYALSQTTGQSSSSTMDARSLSFAGAGGVSVGMSAGSVIISGATGGGGGGGGFSAGISTDGQTSGNTGTVSGQVVFVGTNGIGLSGSTNGGSATVSIQQAPVLQQWAPFPMANLVNAQIGNGSVMVVPIPAMWPVTATLLNFYGSVSVSSSSNSSHAGTLSIAAGIYTLGTGASSASLMSASTGSTNWQWTVTSNSSFNSVAGMRAMPLSINFNMTPGQYFLVFWSQTSSAGANWFSASNLINSQGANINAIGPAIMGGNTVSSNQLIPGLGIYSASSASLPAAIAMSEIYFSAAQAARIPYHVFCNQTY